jgi:outer membrane protein TolC
MLADVKTEASYVPMRSYGDYSTNLPLKDILDKQAWIAFRFDGQDLAAEHGGAARFLVPHLYLWPPPRCRCFLGRSDTATYAPPPNISLDEAIMRAYASRAGYQSRLAQVSAAELARKAAAAGYYPSVSTAVNYGDIGLNPANSHGTVAATAALNIPIFQGGKVHGDVLQAEAALRQNRELLDNLRGQIDQDVRNAFLDMQSAADQVEVARSSVDLANQTLIQARDRFSAGVTDNIEVVQAQQSVASANESLISSLYSYNVSKVELGRAIGNAETGVQEYLKGR